MLLRIEHETSYEYDAPVRLGPHTLLLRPRSDGMQQLVEYALRLEPTGAAVAEGIDLEGNAFTHVTPAEATTRFAIAMRSIVETRVTNPFVVPVATHARHIPFEYDRTLRAGVAPYLDGPPASDAVAALAQRALDDAGGETMPFLMRLAARIANEHKQVIRPDGMPMTPEETLARGEGACRDLAVLFVAACRHVGVAARFVSGYQLPRGQELGDQLHAWAEAFLPSAGWRAFDPSEGLAVADRHVAVAAAADAAGAAPVTGVFAGAGASARLLARVDVRRADAAPSE